MNLSPRRLTRFVLVFVLAIFFSPALSRAEEPDEKHGSTYTPSKENLAAREAFQNDRLGIFIHWGVYSVLGRGEWVMNNEKMTVEQYEPVAAKFNPTKFDATAWVKLFKSAGAKYITITSKHHDGFAMWDSKTSKWDIADATPYKKDILKQLAKACEAEGMKLCFYHSHLDWHHPDYFPRGLTGKAAGRPESGDFNKYLDYMDAQIAELLSGDYGKVGAIWFDGWWDQRLQRMGNKNAAPYATQIDWRLDKTYSLIHKLQPACMVGNNHHVPPFPGEDFQMFEKDLPGENKGGFSREAKIGALPLESCDTLNRHWGYAKDDHQFKSVKELVHYLVNAAGRDANLLLNVGPRPDGTIDPESAERLKGLGEWFTKHEAAIRGTRGGPMKPQDWGVSTHTDKVIYLHIIHPEKVSQDGWLTLTGTEPMAEDVRIRLYDSTDTVEAKKNEDGELMVKIDKPDDIDTILLIEKKK